jgi:type IV pilus assembly protein PilY1
MKGRKMSTKMRWTLWVTGVLGFLASLFSCASPIHADDTALFTIAVRPNVLIILDNSNSMDEDFYGNGVGSFSPSSKTVVGKSVLIGLLNTYINSMRVGLMTYRIPSSSKWYLHNSAYFSSYDSKSYCPNPANECVDYCQTGNSPSRSICQSTCASQNSPFDATYFDELIPASSLGSQKRNTYCNLIYPKTNRVPNPTDLGNYIYYKQALPFYDSANDGILFFYSPGYMPDEYPPNYNSYDVWTNKAGTSDQENGYSNPFANWGLVPTDSDYALGYANFGRRLFSYYVGRTWFANGSPGDGYLHVQANDNNNANNTQLNTHLAMLAPHENDETGYMSCNNTGDPNQCSYIVNSGLTPTAGTLQSAINYFNGSSSYPGPIQYSCQKNFIIYVTDGLPSNDENGNPGSSNSLMPAVLNKLNSLRSLSANGGGTSSTYDVKTFVVGVGLTSTDKVLLDSMAVAGGTDVGGHAYYADNPDQLSTALASVFSNIIENSYSFTFVSVTSTRAVDENYIYEASFEPLNAEPFWRGHLRKYSILSDGNVGSVVWDAGNVLQSTDAAARNILTYKSGVLCTFTAANITPADLGVSTTDSRNSVVGYFRGESAYNPDDWKLGDIFHSNPVTVGSPNPLFADLQDHNNAYDQFSANHQRTSANGQRVVIAGGNDGQLHGFRTSDGTELWSFIPPNFLTRLQNVAHSSNPTMLGHQYFVDGPVIAADAWLGIGDSTHKSATDWKTLLIFGEGRGGGATLWSSSPSCDSGFNSTYTSSYPNYCGYYAFDVSNTTNPLYLWQINVPSSRAPYLGDPWSKMVVGRLKINGNEKWVGFFGGGYNGQNCGATGVCDSRGKGFYVVDLSNGNVIWSYTRADDPAMNYSVPGSVAIVDSDNDGFIDTGYIGDIGGNVWRFKFCPISVSSSCSTADWSGGVLFQNNGGIRPIYTAPTVTKDPMGNLWVYWGTGDKNNPTDTSSLDGFYAVKDNLRSGTYGSTDLENITASTYVDSPTKRGWYLNLSGGGEKILDEATIFGGIAYFATYIPQPGTDPCSRAGTGKLYGIHYTTGASALPDPSGPVGARTRNITLGVGIPMGPIISFKPTGALPPDIYVTESGGTGNTRNLGNPVSTQRVNFSPPTVANRTNILYWQDLRLQ